MNVQYRSYFSRRQSIGPFMTGNFRDAFRPRKRVTAELPESRYAVHPRHRFLSASPISR